MAKSFNIILIISFGMMIYINCQSWAGTYTVDQTCNTTSCCCLNGQLTITGYNSSTYYIASGATGLCNQTVINGTLNATVNANNYSISTIIGGQVYSLTLSTNNRIISASINASNVTCTANAVKNKGIQSIHYYSIWWWCFIMIMIII